MRGVMIQGTASDVGKSLIVTGLCRLFANEGVKVAPFKSQNMSNNSYVTVDGQEIGRAQGIQAEAANIEANVWMNPILLKPRSDQQSEVVLLGKAVKTLSGRSYRERFYEVGIEAIQKGLKYLDDNYEIVVIEGAGSPVEINLKDKELVNMKVAELADVPVVLVADIDRGGVFASIVGTLELFTEEERRRVVGLIINKFRGDISLFEDGISWLEKKTGIPVLGVVPHLDHHMIDGEDSLSISTQFQSKKQGELDIAVISLPYVSNYSDIEPFLSEEDVSIRWVKGKEDFGSPDAVIIPGTKSTISDFEYVKQLQLDKVLKDYVKNGGYIIGLCGGYQMLGEEIIDEAGTDTGIIGHRTESLRIIPTITTFQKEKETIRVHGQYHPNTNFKTNRPIEGYEIHLGKTLQLGQPQYFFELDGGRPEGYFGGNGKIIGTYVHHLFHNDEWRNTWLNMIRREKNLPLKDVVYRSDLKEERYDQLASHIQKHIKWDLLKKLIDQWSAKDEVY